MFQHELQNFGLSEKEALIYLSALELGPSTIQEIAQKTRLIRTTVYNLTRSLTEKGLMTERYEDKRRFLVCQSPDKLLRHIRLEKKELAEQEKHLQAILPELKGLIDVSRSRPKIRFFKGKPGIRQMQEDILRIKNLHSIEEFIPLDCARRLFSPHQRDHRHRLLKILNRTRRKIIYTSKKTLPFVRGNLKLY